MSSYIFIHGKNPSLSKYELAGVFENDVEFQSDLFSIINSEKELGQAVMNRLGGTIKICEMFSGDPVDVIVDNAKTEKIIFGLSMFGGHEQISKVLIGIKNKVKARGRNARFLNKGFSNVSSGQLNKSKILEKGVDLVRCFYQGKEVWGKTVAFQDIDSYSKRDYEKPKRDMKIGMIPPKLAQMMINYSKLKKDATVYDPFCGLGTILMEAALRGNPIMASDIKGRMVEATEINLDWLMKNFPSAAGNQTSTIFQHDATEAFDANKFPENLTVVSEGYLGPPQSRAPDQNKQKEIFKLLDDINAKFFANVSKIIPKGNKLVFILPFFKSRGERVFYPEEYIRQYESFGFKIQNELRSLIYERKEQVVGREILVFERA